MKYTFLILIVITINSALFAQNNLKLTPENPKPSDVIKFSYIPPATVFDATDIIRCIAYKRGNYEDEFAIATGRKTKPVEVILQKNGDSLEGEVQTDADTRLLSFVFTSGDVKWKQVDRNLVLTSGKVDNNNNTGYSMLFYNNDGKVCPYGNYFMGEYLFLEGVNKTGFSNPEKATECFIKELETWPDAKYYGYKWLNRTMENDKETFQSMILKETESLFAAGLTTEKDWNLLVNLSYYLKLKEQGKYFKTLANEKFDKTEGSSAYHVSLWDKYLEEKDISKKEEILNEATKVFNGFSYEDKSKLAYSSGVPMNFKFRFLQDIANEGKLDDYTSYLAKFGFSAEKFPYAYNSFKRALDSLLVHENCRTYANNMGREYYTYYSDRIAKLNAGIQISPSPHDVYYSKAEQKEQMATGGAAFADLCGQLCYKTGEYKKGLKYAEDAQNYMKMLSQPLWDVADYNSRYCVLAEKVLPADECKAEIEKMVASGAWKGDMIDILKRIYVAENNTDDGFETYISGLKEAQNELLQETLKEQMLNEAAPDFSLTDINGKTVKLSDLKGKTVILDFWATWCGPCIASFPAMNKLLEANKNNPGLIFLFVDTFERFKEEQENKDKVVEFMTANNYPFQVVYDFKSKVSESYKVTGIPTKCLIDKNGNLRYRIVGAELNEAKLIDEINAMIETIK